MERNGYGLGEWTCERIPGLDQLTDMWESDDESEEEGVGDGQGVVRGGGG